MPYRVVVAHLNMIEIILYSAEKSSRRWPNGRKECSSRCIQRVTACSIATMLAVNNRRVQNRVVKPGFCLVMLVLLFCVDRVDWLDDSEPGQRKRANCPFEPMQAANRTTATPSSPPVYRVALSGCCRHLPIVVADPGLSTLQRPQRIFGKTAE